MYTTLHSVAEETIITKLLYAIIILSKFISLHFSPRKERYLLHIAENLAAHCNTFKKCMSCDFLTQKTNDVSGGDRAIDDIPRQSK